MVVHLHSPSWLRSVNHNSLPFFKNFLNGLLGKAQVVIDRYHVAKLYRAGADRLRTQELRRLKRELPKEDYAQLKGGMRPLRKKAAD